MYCSQCGQPHEDDANFCGHCGQAISTIPIQEPEPVRKLYVVKNSRIKDLQIAPVSTSWQSFSEITQYLGSMNPLRVRKGHFTRLSWFILANVAIAVSVSIMSGGQLVQMVPYLILVSSIFPFFVLLFSRWLAIRSHHITLIDPTVDQPMVKDLYETVKQLAARAGLKKTPQVGIYESADMNAFATGFSRHHALVAFSSALVESMDDKSIAAVAAHEISHIANGDMITLTLVQSVVNTIINLITIPLKFVNIVAIFDKNVGTFVKVVVTLFRLILTAILIFLGSLVLKAFSRHREFKADALAAKLLDKGAMITALEQLSHDIIRAPKTQTPYASFKIHSPSRVWDIFSTHPSIERRIKALQKQ